MLTVPTRPWQTIGIDFVGPLPESTNRLGGFDTICMVIDHLTLMVHLIPMKSTYKAKQIAELVFENVYKLHSLLEKIVSNRDLYFTSTFWECLHNLIGTELRLSSSFHPQTNGAMERANRMLTTMLHQCVKLDQSNWVDRLPMIEFALNSARSETTGFSPFFLNYSCMPCPMIWDIKMGYPGVCKFTQMMKDAIMVCYDQMIWLFQNLSHNYFT
jgi:hypothetical protein